jgi:hypothetical protein
MLTSLAKISLHQFLVQNHIVVVNPAQTAAGGKTRDAHTFVCLYQTNTLVRKAAVGQHG